MIPSLQTEAAEILSDPGIDIVVELMGGYELHGRLFSMHIRAGKNMLSQQTPKALLAALTSPPSLSTPFPRPLL